MNIQCAQKYTNSYTVWFIHEFFVELETGQVKQRDQEKAKKTSPVVWEVVRIRLGSPSPVTSYTFTVYFLPGRSSLMFTDVAV